MDKPLRLPTILTKEELELLIGKKENSLDPKLTLHNDDNAIHIPAPKSAKQPEYKVKRRMK